MALKLDMRKAYNKVEWDYLKALMLKMRFHSRWVDLVMARMSIVSYSIMVKGVPLGLIKPSRGIHQGILSHFMCFEGFFALLGNAAQQRQLHGISISRNGPQITHLLFADDS